MKIKLVLLLISLPLFSILSFGQTDTVAKKKYQVSQGAGYAQAVLVDNVLYISGTVASGDMAAQLKGAYSKIEGTLKAYGATFQNVVKENLYTTDIEAVKSNNEVRKAFYKGDYPAATWVQISRLFMPQALVEVEVIAHLPKK
ncbi:MAG TPA: RidA family protein [Chitinophagaceae bacterium]|nr:RidA family protein [Chitinophagaceae bacterium]